ncbi:MAG: hypothetical protein GY742_10255 [Hyphomicrobiales bacterium]|nr:hypothetical protein [Hyphomicrobiales bacterium]
MDGESVTPIAQWDLAFAKKASLKDIEYESGMHLLRMTIREGKRITDVNFHAEAALEIGEAMVRWARAQNS